MKILVALLTLLLSAPAFAQAIDTIGGFPQPSGAAGGVLSGTYPNPGFAASPTFTGTVTFPDGATWASTGVADAAAYSTASTPIFTMAPTWTFTSTANNIGAYDFSSTLVPSGATAGNVWSYRISPAVGTSAVNIAELEGLRFAMSTSAGYSGTAALAFESIYTNPTVSGTNPLTEYRHISMIGVSNGNGITSGTVTNSGIVVAAFTAAAGSGGTVANTAAKFTVPSSSSAGNTDRALWITGNGGAASTKYALYSDSTAPSSLAGPLVTSGSTPTIASGACGTTTNGSLASGSRTNAGTVQIGAAATTVCTVVFAVVLPSAPVCVIAAANAAAAGATVLPYVSANTTTGFVITGAVLANTNFNYVCL